VASTQKWHDSEISSGWGPGIWAQQEQRSPGRIVSGAGSLKSPSKFEEPGQEGWGRFLCQATSKGLKSPFDAQGWWCPKGHFTHETESPWPLHFKHSHWWKRRSRSKFAPHFAWGTNIVCECKMDVKSTWIPTWHQMDHISWSLALFLKPALGGRPHTKPGDHGTLYAHNHWFILFYHVWGPAWIDIHWNSIGLRARPHMTSHCT
jgi:hypothetical protein